MARPKRTVPPGGYEKITAMAASGCRELDIAHALGLSGPTWARIKDEDPRALAALEAGRGREHEALVGALFEQCVKGKNAAACMFLLKTRHGYREGFAVEHTSNVRVTFDLPGALTTEQYRVVAEQAPALEDGTDD